MAEPAIRDFPRLPRIDPAWRALSGSTWRRDMGAKKTIYERMGVLEYWILDPAGAYVDPLQQRKR